MSQKMPFKPADIAKCSKCGQSVYAAEERIAGGLKWHKMCFKCGLCQKMLDSTNCAEHDGEIYCKNCHGRKFGPKGYGFGSGAGCLSTDTGSHLSTENHSQAVMESRSIAKAPEGQGCPRCGGFVYMAEQMLAKGRGWHKECFNCSSCSKRLDSVSCCGAPDGEIYCKACYSKYFGPKGYGYGVGAGALQTCYLQRFGPRGFGHSGVNFIGLMSDLLDQERHERYLVTVDNSAPQNHLSVDTTSISAPEGKGCPRCGGAVFMAEQVLAKGREWHKKCFKCHDCNKTLDSVSACDGPDFDIYCRSCYGKKFGPHGYGFACGSGFLQTDGLTEDDMSASRPFYNIDTTTIKAPEGQGCPRCGGVVFDAEKQLAKGSMWHKSCFNCSVCHRPLDSMIACDGPDAEIYCKPCYGKYFGPKGFGYGHAPTLISTNGENTIFYPETAPTTGLKTNDGKSCTRCGFAVYYAEQMISKNRIWHKRCFNCHDCHKSLDSTNLNDAPDTEIYCRACYARNFGPRGVGYGMGAGVLTMT